MLIMPKEKHIRGSNFSKEEELDFVNILFKYKNIIVESKGNNLVTLYERETAWHSILNKFNSIYRPRTLQQLKNKFDNLKTAARKYASYEKANITSTSGPWGSYSDSRKNPVLEIVIEIMNKKPAVDLSNSFDDEGEQNSIKINDIENNSSEAPTTSDAEEYYDFTNQEIPVSDDVQNLPHSANNDLETTTNNWITYSPEVLSEGPTEEEATEKKRAFSKLTHEQCEATSLYNLKKTYIEEKLNSLRNDERRKEELHQKQLELLNAQILDLKNK